MATRKRPAAPANPQTLSINDIGPIQRLELKVEPGTVTVLRGRNGSGKSTVLNAVSALQTRHAGRLETRDGAIGGSASYGGVTIRVGRGGANRRTGELVVHSIEDQIAIGDLVNPQRKTPETADSVRLRALVALSGATADISEFESLARDAGVMVSPDTRKASGLVDMASAFKRDCDAAARTLEQQAELHRREADAATLSIGDVDLTAEHDEAALQDAYQHAVMHKADVESRKNAASEAAIVAARAREALQDDSAVGGEVADIEDERDRCEAELAIRSATVDQLRGQLKIAELARDDKCNELGRLNQQVERARQRDARRVHLMEQIELSQTLVAPSDDELANAVQDVQNAAARIATGIEVRNALVARDRAETRTASARECDDRADVMRHAGQQAELILSKAVGSLCDSVRVDNQLRLRTTHPARGECYVHDLSDGERWRLALDIAIAAAQRDDRDYLLAIPQDAWQDLDARNRRAIVEHVNGTRVSILTAEADGLDDITAETIT